MHTWGRQRKTQAFTKNVVAVDFFILFVPSLGFIFNFYQLNPFFFQQLTIANPPVKVRLCTNLPSPCWSWIQTYLVGVTNTVNSYWSCPAVSRCFPVDTHHHWLWYSLHPIFINESKGGGCVGRARDGWGEWEMGRAIDSLQRWAFFRLILCTFANCGLCANHCYKYKLLRWRLTDALIYN